MKIGILTFHRALNYGAVLQCYALQETLKKCGHEVYVIDYRQKKIEEQYKLINWYWFVKKLPFPNKLYQYIKDIRKKAEKKKCFSFFTQNYLNITEKSYSNTYPSGFDVYIIGSDQLWNFKITKGIDSIYTGAIKGNVVGYAISTNKKSLNEISVETLKNILKNFNKISFREAFIRDLIYKKTQIKYPQVLDPTLLADANIWDKITNNTWINKEYVLVYQVRYIIGKMNALHNIAELLAKNLNCSVIDISEYTYSVSDFISLIKYSKCVITSSFHAVAFSLIFEKQFYAYKLNDGNDERYTSLLNDLNVNNAIVDLNFIPYKNNDIDYKIINNKLQIFKDSSMKFLSFNDFNSKQ